MLAYVAEKLSRRDELWSVLDSVVLLEDEGPLLALVKTVPEGRANLSRVHLGRDRDPLGTGRFDRESKQGHER